jgi:hypothetical protein
VDKAIAGEYDHWGKDPYSALAFIVLAVLFPAPPSPALVSCEHLT